MLSPLHSREEQREIASLFAKLFISRPDVKAYQRSDGTWYPDRSKITMSNMVDHLAGDKTMGHYLVSEEATCKFLAFDIDLEEAKPDKQIFFPMPGDFEFPDIKAGWASWYPGNPRGTWIGATHDPKSGVTPMELRFIIFQLRSAAHLLIRGVEELLGLRTAMSYSGSKGIHVYAFFDQPESAETARAAAQAVLEATGFALHRGHNFFKFAGGDGDPLHSMQQLSVEVYPKQDSVANYEKKLGNLLRLPLGVNLKGSGRPAPMFLDVRAAMTELKARNPIDALTNQNQWAGE